MSSDSGKYTCTAIDLPQVEPAFVTLTVEDTCKSDTVFSCCMCALSDNVDDAVALVTISVALNSTLTLTLTFDLSTPKS